MHCIVTKTLLIGTGKTSRYEFDYAVVSDFTVDCTVVNCAIVDCMQ